MEIVSLSFVFIEKYGNLFRVHGDVFRPPRRKNVLAALIGSGIQIFLMSFIVIGFAALGMLSPSSRGALVTAACFLYVFMG